jgi:hypothetical protein
MPAPAVRWLKDGEPIFGERFEVSVGRGPTHWLVVRSIRTSDAGKYSCIAENVKGVAWCAVALSVLKDGSDEIPIAYQQAPLFTAKVRF